MKGIISSHSALTAYQRQTGVDPVATRSTLVQEREGVASASGVRAVRVSISAEARAMASGEAAEASAPIDRAKVEQLREALRSGALKFDSELVAQRMIDQGE